MEMLPNHFGLLGTLVLHNLLFGFDFYLLCFVSLIYPSVSF